MTAKSEKQILQGNDNQGSKGNGKYKGKIKGKGEDIESKSSR
jgi:hypothetical protein